MKIDARWLACLFAASVMVRAQTATETVLHNFKNPPKGESPNAGLIRDAAGNFYGTAFSGGTANAGTVFKLSPTGEQTVLHSFTGGADGGYPYAGVVRDSAGNLYGTTSAGGLTTGVCAGAAPVGCGVVFKLDPSGQETVLYSFTGGTDGFVPYAGVIRDAEGNLYGTTFSGGANTCFFTTCGAVYKVDTAGHETVLYNFKGGTDGSAPGAGVIRDSAGNLYGTTFGGGSRNCEGGCGTVYKLDTAGNETVLFRFNSNASGLGPFLAGVIRDSSGNLYGTTANGGAGNCGGFPCGVVYKVDTSGHETVLHTFTGGADGGEPLAGLTLDSAGNLYGTASAGGVTTGSCGSSLPSGCGVVFKIDPSGQETVLYNFSGQPDGDYPSSVILDVAGNLYGTTQHGGAAGLGAVFELDTAGQETLLYGFPGPAGGNEPFGGVIRDSSGNFYGTTYDGGPVNFGTVYKLDVHGRETTLYSFTGGADGSHPHAGVVRDSAGNLYGTANLGGSADLGAVFKLDSAGHETVLHSFMGGTDGAYPLSGVTRDAAGNLFGTTDSGGTANAGVVYKLDTAGNWTVLYSFTGGADGGAPFAGVIADPAGNLYGTTVNGGTGYGVVYTLNASGQETVLYRFTGGSDGAIPWGGVIRDSAGNLYGTTAMGGRANRGVVYTLDPAGQESTLYSFTGGADGGTPQTSLAIDSSGNLYGTTYNGGPRQAGVVFELDTAGQETALYGFMNGADGGFPQAGVIRDAAGNLYGTTQFGGTGPVGVVFKVTP